jgi:acyl carrier protein
VTGSSPEALLAALRRVLEQEFAIPAEDVTPDARLREDLDLDSVDAVSLAARLEEDTGLALSEQELKAMRTVASVVEVLRARLAARESAARGPTPGGA